MSMRIHPAGTPLARVAIGEAIASLPCLTVLDIITMPAQDGTRLEFVRFLTERDGQRIHVWKRTR